VPRVTAQARYRKPIVIGRDLLECSERSGKGARYFVSE
jgi:hypothetical protein